jgi:release factor glutamine methyltransferase
MIVRLPGVYRPQHDTELLTEALTREELTPTTRVLDLCAGTGALSIAASRAGACRVVAVDISRRAVLNTRINGILNRTPIIACRSNLTQSVQHRVFDLIVSNPPYVPSEVDELPKTGSARAWNGGTDGRALLDRIANAAPDVLAPGGTLLLVQSSLCGVRKTETMLEEHGMTVEIFDERFVPFGPVMRSRRALLENRGLIDPDQDTEQLVVLRATKPLPSDGR